MRRRTFSLLAGGTLLSARLAAGTPIDRQRVVRRHHVVLDKADPWAPLSLGNGAFAFTADVTGLQSFPDHYGGSIPLAAQSEWGWHSFPAAVGYTRDDTLEAFDTAGRGVFYPTRQNSPAGQALRQSPHRLGLARIGFVFTGADGSPADSFCAPTPSTFRRGCIQGLTSSPSAARSRGCRPPSWWLRL